MIRETREQVVGRLLKLCEELGKENDNACIQNGPCAVPLGISIVIGKIGDRNGALAAVRSHIQPGEPTWGEVETMRKYMMAIYADDDVTPEERFRRLAWWSLRRERGLI